MFNSIGQIEDRRLATLAQKELNGQLTPREAWEYKILMEAWEMANEPATPNPFEEDGFEPPHSNAPVPTRSGMTDEEIDDAWDKHLKHIGNE